MTIPVQRVAIVTGASRSMGAAIARRLADDGISVVVNYASSRQNADEVIATIEATGGRAIAVQADIANSSGIRTLFDAAEAELGGVDILVNNAGVMTLGPLTEVDDDAFEAQLAINLGGTFRGMREAARRLRDGGRILNFSSSVVGLYQPGYGVYAATKAAVEAMTHILAKELGQRRISVNAVRPAPSRPSSSPRERARNRSGRSPARTRYAASASRRTLPPSSRSS